MIIFLSFLKGDIIINFSIFLNLLSLKKKKNRESECVKIFYIIQKIKKIKKAFYIFSLYFYTVIRNIFLILYSN